MEERLACIRFNHVGKSYYFSTDLDLHKGDKVVVETIRGLELGELITDLKDISEFNLDTELKKIKRKANRADIDVHAFNKVKASKSLEICKDIVKEYDLDMHLVSCEYTLDASKVIFMYTSESRVDFRELLKELASVFKCRIELRQIGVRDEIRRIGGNGACGRELCCCSFLGNFETVSIKMAKEQNISLNPSKISGCCGRLMCCLKYEQNVYEEKLSRLPRIGAIVKTEEGTGEVCGIETLKEIIKVKLNDGEETYFKKFEAKDVEIIKNAEDEEKLNVENQEDLKELEALEKLEEIDSKNSNDDI